MTVEIRPWQGVSLERLLALKPGFDARDLDQRLREVRQHGDGWFIAIVDGEVIGWVVVRWHGKPAHSDHPFMEDLYVMEAWRGRGVGTALIGFVEVEARRRGYAKIGIAVNPTMNERARSLYERLGYEPTGGDVYLDGIYDGDEDWVIDLQKNL